MICKNMGRNICLVIVFLASVMIFYAISLFYIHSSVMGKSSIDFSRERLHKKELLSQEKLKEDNKAKHTFFNLAVDYKINS